MSDNLDVFAWSPTDMPEIDREIICHKLSIKAKAELVKKKPRRMNEERSRAISDEVNRLLQTGFIREMFYPNWLSNPILVKKKNGKWRVCIDFTNLNEACPNSSYPLLRIDQLVEATTSHELHSSWMPFLLQSDQDAPTR